MNTRSTYCLVMMMVNSVPCWLDNTSKTSAQTQTHSCLQARNNRGMWPRSQNTLLYKNPFNSPRVILAVQQKTLNFIGTSLEVVENINLAICFFEIPLAIRDMVKGLFTRYRSKKKFRLKQNDWKKGLVLLLNAVPFYSNHFEHRAKKQASILWSICYLNTLINLAHLRRLSSWGAPR